MVEAHHHISYVVSSRGAKSGSRERDVAVPTTTIVSRITRATKVIAVAMSSAFITPRLPAPCVGRGVGLTPLDMGGLKASLGRHIRPSRTMLERA